MVDNIAGEIVRLTPGAAQLLVVAMRRADNAVVLDAECVPLARECAKLGLFTGDGAHTATLTERGVEVATALITGHGSTIGEEFIAVLIQDPARDTNRIVNNQQEVGRCSPNSNMP